MKSGRIRRIILSLLVVIIIAATVAIVYFNSDSFRASEILEEAQMYLESENYSAAASLFEYTLELEEDNLEAKYGLVQSGLAQEDYDLAKKYLDELASTEESKDAYKEHLYAYAFEAGDYPLAHSLISQNSEYEPTEDEYIELISGLMEIEYYQQASGLVDTALVKFPENNDIKTLALNINLQADNKEEVIRLFESGIEGLDAPKINEIAAIYESNGDIENLISLLEDSLELDHEQLELKQQLYLLYAANLRIDELWDLRENLLLLGEELPELEKNVVGNNFGNVRYHSLAAQEANTIYYITPNFYQLYRAPTDDLDAATPVYEQHVQGLNVVDSILYFVDVDNNSSLSKINADGTGYEVLWVESTVIDPIVFGDTVFFINGDNMLISKINIDGTGYEELSSLQAYQFVLDNEYFYFIESNNRGIYRQAHDKGGISGEAEILIDGNFKDLNIDEFSTLYYLDMDSGGHIYKYDTANNTETLIASELADYLNYHDNVLYFVNWTANRIDTNGDNRFVLASHFSSDVAITDSWVFSLHNNYANWLDIFYFKHDGTEYHTLIRW